MLLKLDELKGLEFGLIKLIWMKIFKWCESY